MPEDRITIYRICVDFWPSMCCEPRNHMTLSEQIKQFSTVLQAHASDWMWEKKLVFALFDYTTTINSVTPWNIQEQCGKCCRFQEKPKKLGRSILCSVNVAVHSCNAYVLSCYCRMTMTVYYLVHYEQLSLESYEYIDCGANTTVPHSMQPPPPW